MPSYRLIAFTNALEGQDDEFNAWYDRHHIFDVMKIKGFKSVQRFRQTKEQRTPNPAAAPAPAETDTFVLGCPWTYLAIYTVETDDLRGLLTEFSAKSGTDAIPITPAMGPRRATWTFVEMSPAVSAP